MRKILIAILFVLGFAMNGHCQIKLSGDFEVKVVDGNIDDVQALKALRYLKNVYKRNTSVSSNAQKILKYHHGKYEGHLKFLLGKSYFMDAVRHKGKKKSYWNLKEGWDHRGVSKFKDSWSYTSEIVPVSSILENSYKTFLNFYDEFRDHELVKNKTLRTTIERLIPKLLTHEAFELGTRKSYVQLDNLLRFGALYTYITGEENQAINKYINQAYSAGSISIDYSAFGNKYRQFTGISRYGRKKTYNYKGYYIASRYEKQWGKPKQDIRLRNTAGIIFQVLISNALHKEFKYFEDPKIARIDPHTSYDGEEHYVRIVELPKLSSLTYFPTMNVNIDGNAMRLSGLNDYLKDNNSPLDFKIYYKNKNHGNQYLLDGKFDGTCKVEKVVEFNGAVSAIPLKFGEISFPNIRLIDLIKAKHGSVYDWVGILNNDDIL